MYSDNLPYVIANSIRRSGNLGFTDNLPSKEPIKVHETEEQKVRPRLRIMSSHSTGFSENSEYLLKKDRFIYYRSSVN